MNNVYKKPQSDVLNEDIHETPKPGIVLKVLLVLFTILAFFASFFNQLLATGVVASGVGGGIAPLLMGGLVVGIFQLRKRFRNTRSRYKIFLWCQVIFFISALFGMLSEFAQTVNP